MKIHAVLTGDLIGSSKLGAAGLEQAMNRLRELAADFEKIHPGTLVGQPDVFRGDSWQLCLQDPARAVTAVVFLRAGLKGDGLDSRVGIGLGEVASLHADRISTSSGPAFVASGSALDALAKGRTLGFAHAMEPSPAWADGISGWLAPLLDLLLSQWSEREALAVYGTLRQLTQQEIADRCMPHTREGKAPTRQAVQDALQRIGWATHVGPVLEDVEKSIRSQLAQ